jgi:uncharacterized protein (TIGR02145 family)/uncharacterized repeat protein (TIGR02543 family)
VVKFDSRGGSAVGSHHVEHGSKTTEPKDPTRANFNFDGWYKDSVYTATTAWDFDVDVVNAPTTLYAKWTTLVVRVVTFNAQGGSALSPQHVENGKTAVEHPSALAGYTLEGWYKEAAYTTKWNFASPVTADMTLYAKWTVIPYTITYVLDGGTVSAPINPTTYTFESAAITLKNPTKTGYTFAGWTGPNGQDPHTTVAISTGSIGDKTYTAKWTPIQYDITYTLNGGTVSAPANPTSYNIESAFTLKNPTKNGFTFEGWTGDNGETEQTTVSIAAGSTGPKSYTANWTLIPKFTDSRNGKEYNKVLIGEQVWMKENLDYAGDDDNNPLGACYNDEDANCDKYGRLYSWAEAMNGEAASSANPSGVLGACPVGWHLPSQEEWTVLSDYVGDINSNGAALKTSEGWTARAGIPTGTNTSGFTALPGGVRDATTSYSIGNNASFWSATTNASDVPYFRRVTYDAASFGALYNGDYWLSIRCVQD